MAVTDLLSQNENQAIKELQANIERNGFNISETNTFPMEVGKIYPFYSRKMLPGDHFNIDVNVLLRQLQPMLVPQMVSFKLNTAFYYLDYRVAFPEIEMFFANQQGKSDIELPYLYDSVIPTKTDSDKLLKYIPSTKEEVNANVALSATFLDNNLRTFLNLTRNTSNEKVDPMPFFTYQRVYRDFYLPLDRLSSSVFKNWFPDNPRHFALKPGLNRTCLITQNSHSSNVYSNGPVLTDLRHHTVRDDYFVSSYPRPLRGNVPGLEGSTSLAETDGQLKLDFLVDNILQSELDSIYNGYHGDDQTDATYTGTAQLLRPDNDYGVESPIKMTVGGHGVSNISFNGSEFSSKASNYNLLKERIVSKLNTYNRATYKFNDLTLNFNVTEQTLRVLRQNTRWREAMMLSKPTIKHYVRNIYGQDIGEDILQGPIYIGGTSQDIIINEIEQSVATETTPLGSQGATAMSLAKNRVGNCFSRFFGWIIGVAYILPDYKYEPAIPREMQERTLEDWFNPYFTHLSMQAILNKELFVSDDDEWNNQVLGYNGMYDNYRNATNKVSGLMLSGNTDIENFAQVRRFTDDNKPEITPEFLDAYKNFDKTVFAVPSMPPFICQFATLNRAVRPLPKVATPK